LTGQDVLEKPSTRMISTGLQEYKKYEMRGSANFTESTWEI
jgi:hypothetical protein